MKGSAVFRCAVGLWLVLLLVPVPTHGAMSIEEKLVAGRDLLFQGNFAEGEKLLAQVVRELGREQNDVPSLLVLGQAYFYLEEDDRALKVFARALELAPETAEAHFYSGLIHAYGGDFAQAMAFFAAAAEYEPDSIAYWVELGRSSSFAGFAEKALSAYERALELDPDHPEALYNSGVVLSRLGRPEQSLDHFVRALAVMPDYPDAAYNAGVILNDMGQPKDAQPYLELAVAQEPNNWETLELLIQVYQANDARAQRDEAIVALHELRRSGKAADLAGKPYYVRDRFYFGDQLVVAVEHFDMLGDMPRKYVFAVFESATGQKLWEISLGSYEFTKAVARDLGTEGADDLWHLDGYWPDGSHATYGFYTPEPTYDTVRVAVLAVLGDEAEPISGFRP